MEGGSSGARVRHPRNVVLDVLRGYCVVMMITGHVGTETHINHSIHFLRFVSGAEGFVFLSGLVLGLVYRRRVANSVLGAYANLWRRAAMIWLVHVTLVLGAAGLNGRLYSHADIPAVSQFGWKRYVLLTASLQMQPGHALNILPLYVLLIGAAPLALELLRRRLTLVLLSLSMGGLIWSQYQPGALSFVHASCGDGFPPLAWQGLFFPGMIIGYHYAFIRDRIIAPYRTALLYGLVALTACIAVVVWVQTPSFEFYDHVRWDLALFNRHPLRLGRVAYFLISIAALYLVVQVALGKSRLLQPPLQALALLGKNSLYSFITHILISLPLTDVVGGSQPGIASEAATALTVALVYVMARYQVGRPIIPN